MKAINSTTIVSGLISELLKNKFSRNLFRPKLDRYIRENIFKNSISKNPEFVKLYPYYALRAMYMSYFRNYDKGCISSGRHGGYFYINWDSNIMPCVFVPHYIDNVNSIYSSGKTLSDAMFSPLFVEGRKWQEDYAYGKDKMGNLLMPCLYRDHYKNFFEIAKRTGAQPENQASNKALNSKEYYDAMLKFDEELDKVSSPVWDELAGISMLHVKGEKHRLSKKLQKNEP